MSAKPYAPAELVEAARKIFKFDISGAYLHIVLSDWNASDGNLDFCMSEVEANADGLPADVLTACREVIAALRRVPESTRIQMLAALPSPTFTRLFNA